MSQIQSIGGGAPSGVSPPSTAGNQRLAAERDAAVRQRQNQPVAQNQETSPTKVNKANEGQNDKENLSDAIKKLNEFVSNSSDLQFSVDKDTSERVIKVVDRQTKEVIRQIPSEEALRIAKALDQLKGLLVRDQA